MIPNDKKLKRARPNRWGRHSAGSKTSCDPEADGLQSM